MNLFEILDEVTAEIDRAEAKHGPRHVGGDQLTDEERWHVLMGEVREVRDAIVHGGEPPHDLRSEIIDALAVLWQWAGRL
jgi:hypothetical protein